MSDESLGDRVSIHYRLFRWALLILLTIYVPLELRSLSFGVMEVSSPL